MSWYDWIPGPWQNLSMPTGAGGIGAPMEVPEPPKQAPVSAEEKAQTHRQMILNGQMIGAGVLDGAVGGYGQPGGFPADSNDSSPRRASAEATRTLASTYWNYRRMRADGMVAIGRAMADALICANTWAYEARVDDQEEPEDALKEAAAALQHMWESKGGFGAAHQGVSLREFILSDSCRAKDYGNHTLEVVYGENDDGQTVVKEFLQCLPETTRPLVVEGTRQYAGVRNWGMGGGPIDLSPQYCIRFIYDAEGGDLFGRSRFENCKDWIQLKWDLRDKIRTDMNISIGNTMVAGYPVDDNGVTENTTANERKAATIGVSLSRGMTVTKPTFSLKNQMALAQLGIDASKLDPWPIKRLDTGQNSFAGFDVAVNLVDEQILFGLLVPPRTVREAEHGSKADAEQHTGSLGVMAWQWITYVSGCAQLITDEILAQWGLERGSVQIVPAPLDDKTLAMIEKIFTTLLSADKDLAVKLLEVKAMADQLNVKTRADFDQEALISERKAAGGDSTILSRSEKMRSMGYDENKIAQIKKERAEDDAIPQDDDGLGAPVGRNGHGRL